MEYISRFQKQIKVWQTSIHTLRHRDKRIWGFALTFIMFGLAIYWSGLLTDETMRLSPEQVVSLNERARVVTLGYVDVSGGVRDVSANMSGVIQSVPVRVGDKIKQGDILAEQDDTVEQIELSHAIARLDIEKERAKGNALQLKAAKRELESLNPLVEIGAINETEYARQRDNYQNLLINEKANALGLAQTEVAIEQAKYRLQQRKIRSPINGEIVRSLARKGFATSDTNIESLFSILPDEPLVVHTQIHAHDIDKVALGQKAQVYLQNSPENASEASVMHIAPYVYLPYEDISIDSIEEKQTIKVTLQLSTKHFMLGQLVRIEFDNE